MNNGGNRESAGIGWGAPWQGSLYDHPSAHAFPLPCSTVEAAKARSGKDSVPVELLHLPPSSRREKEQTLNAWVVSARPSSWSRSKLPQPFGGFREIRTPLPGLPSGSRRTSLT